MDASLLSALAAKNAILSVEFAKAEYEKGTPLIDAALEGARLRLRPILMTSFAFICGCLPLWFASGSGAVSRRVLGSTVIGGMIAASGIAIFLIPVTFNVVERTLFTRARHRSSATARTRGHSGRGTAIMSDSGDGFRRQLRVKACRFLGTAAGTHVTPATNSHHCHMTRTMRSRSKENFPIRREWRIDMRVYAR
jgi:hypothetical protein